MGIGKINRSFALTGAVLFLALVAASFNNCAQTEVDRPALKSPVVAAASTPLPERDVATIPQVNEVTPTPAPQALLISEFEPPEIEENTPTQITIKGEGFVEGTVVLIGGETCANVTIVSPTELTCDLPASASVGDFDIQITTPKNETKKSDKKFRRKARPTPTPIPVQTKTHNFTPKVFAGRNGTASQTINLLQVFPELRSQDFSKLKTLTVSFGHGSYSDNAAVREAQGCQARENGVVLTPGAPNFARDTGGRKSVQSGAQLNLGDRTLTLSGSTRGWGNCGDNTCGGCLDRAELVLEFNP